MVKTKAVKPIKEKKVVENKLVISYPDIQALTLEGKSLLFTPKANSALKQLLDLEVKVATAIKEVEKFLEEKALEFDVEFSSIIGEDVKATYRAWGSKYIVDESEITNLPVECYKTEVGTIAPNRIPLEELKAQLAKIGWVVKETKEVATGNMKPDFKRSVDSKVVEKMAKDLGGLPLGVKKANREKKITISLVKDKAENE